MNSIYKVVWSEGMFLRPLHFQQQERYIEFCIQHDVAALEGYFWGFSDLEIDHQMLKLGTIQVKHASGLLPDGTPFLDLGMDRVRPLAFDFPPHVKNAVVSLALPSQRGDGLAVIFDEDHMSAARFIATEFEVEDVNAQSADAAEIQVALPRFRLMLETDVPQGWISMRLARVIERQADNVLRMDQEFIPPTLNCQTQKNLASFIHEMRSLLDQRRAMVAARLSAGGRGGVSEIGEFLILVCINRWLPLMVHLEQIKVLHPERLFAHLLCMAGELVTFSSMRERVFAYPVYIHDDLWASFQPLLVNLRQALATVLDQTVMHIDLQEKKYGIKIAQVADHALFNQASFVLAVRADLPVEQVQTQFPAQVKIGPVENIQDLVNVQLPGIPLRLLPVAPRELPFHAGYSYFEIDTQHRLWKELGRSAGMALHIAGNFPGLGLECWAIRK